MTVGIPADRIESERQQSACNKRPVRAKSMVVRPGKVPSERHP